MADSRTNGLGGRDALSSTGCMAPGLSTEDEGKQVNTLLYCLGEEAGEVFAACDATDKAKKVYAEAVHTFEKFFGVRKNLIFERARVNSRDQMEGESTEQYLLVLHALARNCEYGQLREELICDRIVIGILDKVLSKRLQMDPELTLEKASRMRTPRVLDKEMDSVKGEVRQYSLVQLEKERVPGWQTSQHVPIPLRKQVQTELDQMEACGVISKVDIPTPWWAGMVVAQKPNGAIRICVDLKPLNESVLREVYPLPRVDEILAQLSRSKVFTTQLPDLTYFFVAAVNTNRPKLKDLQHLEISDWGGLGLDLGLSKDMIDIIKTENKEVQFQRREMFSCWLKTSNEPSYEILIRALRMSKDNVIAKELEEKYCRNNADIV
ncbi:hypothetical protein EMCRGX_G010260 [Ephydatia muelleri]